jgi:hypothetical protein
LVRIACEMGPRGRHGDDRGVLRYDGVRLAFCTRRSRHCGVTMRPPGGLEPITTRARARLGATRQGGARMLTDFQKKKLSRTFQIYDADGDGIVTKADYERAGHNVAIANGFSPGSAESESVNTAYLAA